MSADQEKLIVQMQDSLVSLADKLLTAKEDKRYLQMQVDMERSIHTQFINLFVELQALFAALSDNAVSYDDYMKTQGTIKIKIDLIVTIFQPLPEEKKGE